MRNRSFAVAVLLAASIAAPARAQSTVIEAQPGQTFVFATVDDYELDYVWPNFGVIITGILQGESEAKRIRFNGWVFNEETARLPARCERLALVSMSRPGRYLFAVRQGNGVNDSGLEVCKLTRLP